MKNNKFFKVFVVILIIVVLACAAYYAYKNQDAIRAFLEQYFGDDGDDDGDDTVVVSGDLSIHFLQLGQYNGDIVYIKVGDVDIIVDSGKEAACSEKIYNYICVQNKFVTDGVLEYVIATHADSDHITGFVGSNSCKGIFDRFECKTIIDFPLTNKTTNIYNNYIAKRDAEVEQGAKRYSALECYNQSVEGAQRVFQLSEDVELEILYNYYYENTTTDENNYSVCFMLNHGERHFLFTGDLEELGEEKLVQYNDLPKVELFKAGHHGSKTSSNDCLLEVIQPKICVVCCVAGSCEYTNILKNMFPTQAFINRIAKYTQKVYVTDICEIEAVYDDNGDPVLDRYGYQKYKMITHGAFNGDIIVDSQQQQVVVNCSDSTDYLKDSDWIKAYRDIPSQWAA